MSDQKKGKESVDSIGPSPYSITEEILAKRLRRPIYGNICRQLFAGILACLSSISFGTCLGWANTISRIMLSADRLEKFSENEIAWFVSINLLGCSIGITSLSFFMKQMGPKKIIRIIGPPYILTWCLILAPSVNAQLTARFFLGFLGVSHSAAGEILLLHTVHYGIRRYITIFYTASTVLGVFISRVVGTAISTFWLTMMCTSIPVIHYILIQIVPESPVYLYATSEAAAAKSLTWYRGEGNFYVEMAYIKRDWDATRQDPEVYRYMLFSRVVYRPLLLIFVVILLQVASGYFVFMFYSIEVLSGGRVAFSPVIDSAILAACFIFTKLFWATLHATYRDWKLRKFLITSCFLTALCLGLFSMYLTLEHFQVHFVSDLSWTPTVIVMFFLFFVDMGLGHFPRILVLEYMPFQLYKRVDLITQSVYWLLSFICIFTFAATFNKTARIYAFFAVTAGIMFLGSLFCYIFVIEPKGKSLIQIQLAFGGNPIGTRGALYNQIKQSL